MNYKEIAGDLCHLDFTTASEWEAFVARLEAIVSDWKLYIRKMNSSIKDGDFLKYPEEQWIESLSFADVQFELKYFRLKINSNKIDNISKEEFWTDYQNDMLNSNYFVQYDTNFHKIAQFYGTREFLVLEPLKHCQINDETRIKMLLSSLTIALHNCHCELPVLVQVHQSWQMVYFGINVGKGSRVQLNMIHLKNIPPHYQHLTGLLSLFKQKIGEGCRVQLNPVMVSIRFSYILENNANNTRMSHEPDFNFLQKGALDVELNKLPLGTAMDPIQNMKLFVTWPQLSENVIVDSEGFSNLDPLSAPEWSLQVQMGSKSISFLGQYLRNMLQFCTSHKRLDQLLGGITTLVDFETSSFYALEESKHTGVSHFLRRITIHNNNIGSRPIPEKIIVSILSVLFPDAAYNPHYLYVDYTDHKSWRGIKSCAIDSFVWRLAIVVARASFNFVGLEGIAQIWYHVMQEINYRWENGILIPGISHRYSDDVDSCLLQQKLQIVNYCIDRKILTTFAERKHQSLGTDTETADVPSKMKLLNNSLTFPLENTQPATTCKGLLLDDMLEGEKELHCLSSMKMGEIAKHILPVLSHVSLFTLHDQRTDAVTGFPELIQCIHNKLQYTSKSIHPNVKLYLEVIQDIENVDELIARAKSLHSKFGGMCELPDSSEFFIQLLTGEEVSIPNGPQGSIGNRVASMFINLRTEFQNTSKIIMDTKVHTPVDQGITAFPAASKKEFILRSVIPRPSSSSSPQPQRMYVCLDTDSIRLAGAFSEDTIFV